MIPLRFAESAAHDTSTATGVPEVPLVYWTSAASSHAGLDGSNTDDTLPIPEICLAALRQHRERQAARKRAGDRWQDSDLVFTTRWGTPIEPRNFNRSFDARCAKAGVRRIPVYGTRRTCAGTASAAATQCSVACTFRRSGGALPPRVAGS